MVTEGVFPAFWARSKNGYKAKPLSVCLQTPSSPCAIFSHRICPFTISWPFQTLNLLPFFRELCSAAALMFAL